MDNNIPQFSSFLLRVLILCITLFTTPSFSALQDFCVADLKATPTINGFPCKAHVTSEDFFYSGLKVPLNTSNPRGLGVNVANVMTFPGLNTMGISMYIVALAAGISNPPHSHPGETEVGLVLKGSFLVGFLTTNYTLYQKVVRTGDMFVVPPGLVHYEMNVGKTEARLLAVVTNEMPSEVALPHTLFLAKPEIPNAVLMKAFKADVKTIKMLKSKFATK